MDVYNTAEYSVTIVKKAYILFAFLSLEVHEWCFTYQKSYTKYYFFVTKFSCYCQVCCLH